MCRVFISQILEQCYNALRIRMHCNLERLGSKLPHNFSLSPALGYVVQLFDMQFSHITEFQGHSHVLGNVMVQMAFCTLVPTIVSPGTGLLCPQLSNK